MRQFPNRNKRVITAIASYVVIILLYASLTIFLNSSLSIYTSTFEKDEMKTEIENIYNQRNMALASGDSSSLTQFFDTSQKYGKWTLEHEVKRVGYIKEWSNQRGMSFKGIVSTVRVKKIYPTKKNTVRMGIEETYRFDYTYPADTEPVINSFGVGIRHTVDLINKEGKWIVFNDWYTDCFEDALSGYSGNVQSNITFPAQEDQEVYYEYNVNFKSKYNRQKAVEYADKYCGAAWGSGNNFKYNKIYGDYTGIGGDCTNFASQVLGDKDAGGLAQDGSWHCSYNRYGNSKGSRAWLNADGLKDYLLYSGKGRIIKRGTFKELISPTSDSPKGVIGKIIPGDLICYAKKNDIDHFAVVTGIDSHGYPYVNSHTTDRYHVPWDLGWGDKHIKFYLMHIRD